MFLSADFIRVKYILGQHSVDRQIEQTGRQIDTVARQIDRQNYVQMCRKIIESSFPMLFYILPLVLNCCQLLVVSVVNLTEETLLPLGFIDNDFINSLFIRDKFICYCSNFLKKDFFCLKAIPQWGRRPPLNPIPAGVLKNQDTPSKFHV